MKEFYDSFLGTGEVVGSCAAIKQKDDLYFVGLYAVRLALQGRGIGMKMWDYAMRRIGDSNAGLNAVPKHLSTYRLVLCIILC